jgi:branched-chain amino acid transport system substrate-binding protein
VEAIQRAGTTDKEQVRTALENTRSYVGVTGGFNLSPTDHLGLNDGALTMMEIRRGEFIAIGREEMSQDDVFDP